MLDAAKVFIACIFLFLAGYPAYSFLLPEEMQIGPCILGPFLGLATLSVFSPVFLLLPDFPWMKRLALLWACLGLFAVLLTRKSWRPRGWKAAPQLAGLFVFLAVLSFGWGQRLSTGIINGVDAAGYSATANAILNWQGREDLLKRLQTELGGPPADSLLENVDGSLDIQVNIASEYLLKAFRWSYSVVLALLTSVTAADSVYQMNSVLLAVSQCALVAVVFSLCGFLVDKPMPKVLLATCAVFIGLNANLLNIIVQGQYAQVVGLPLLTMFCAVYMRSRSESNVRPIKQFAFMAFLIAALMPLYNEMVLVAFGLIAVVFAMDLVLRGSTWRVNFRVLLGMLLGQAVAWPVTRDWLGFLQRHLKHIVVGGTPQPHWAWPAEVMGLVNLYDRFVPLDAPRSFTGLSLAVLGTFLIVPLAVMAGRRLNKAQLPIVAGALMFVVGIFLKTRYWEGIHSYQYMKAYTYFLPLFMAVFFSLLWNLLADRKFAVGIASLVLAVSASASVEYSICARANMFWIGDGLNADFAAKAAIEKRLVLVESMEAWNRPHFGMSRPIDLLGYFMGGFGPFRWLNAPTAKQIGPHLQDEVVVLLFKDPAELPSGEALAEFEIVPELPGWKVAWQDRSKLLIITPYKGSDLISVGSNSQSTATKNMMIRIISTVAINLHRRKI